MLAVEGTLADECYQLSEMEGIRPVRCCEDAQHPLSLSAKHVFSPQSKRYLAVVSEKIIA